MRAWAMGILAGIGACAIGQDALAEPATTRIETRPFYGATVTLEHGVRVFRPLPPHDRVIINPGGKTPVSLNYTEAREFSVNEYLGGPPPALGNYGPTFYGTYGNMLPRGRRHFHHRGRPSQGHGGSRFFTPRR